MPVIEAVMWDFGGVFSPSPFSAIEAIALEKGYDPGRFLESIFGPYDSDGDHPWHRLERGELDFVSARESIVEQGAAQGMEADPIELFTRMGDSGGGMREDVIALACDLKRRGMKTAIVTNNAHEFRERWTQSIPLDEVCHHVVDSSEVGVRKPDPRIYEIALERLGGVDPARALFVDDFAPNVAAAEALGIRGVHMPDDYRPTITLIRELIG